MNECLQSLRLAECRGSERKEVVFYMLMRLKSFKSCMKGEGATRREMGRVRERETAICLIQFAICHIYCQIHVRTRMCVFARSFSFFRWRLSKKIVCINIYDGDCA